MFQEILQVESGGGSGELVNISAPLVVTTQIIKSSENTNNPAINLFDDLDSTVWYVSKSASTFSDIFVGYNFIEKYKFKSATVGQLESASYKSATFRFEGSNDNINWKPLTEDITQTKVEGTYEFTKNVDKYQYYRVFIVRQTFTTSMYGGRLHTLKFNGEFYFYQ